jgi:hypothetical protein
MYPSQITKAWIYPVAPAPAPTPAPIAAVKVTATPYERPDLDSEDDIFFPVETEDKRDSVSPMEVQVAAPVIETEHDGVFPMGGALVIPNQKPASAFRFGAAEFIPRHECVAAVDVAATKKLREVVKNSSLSAADKIKQMKKMYKNAIR